jgi:hypothetical protein
MLYILRMRRLCRKAVRNDVYLTFLRLQIDSSLGTFQYDLVDLARQFACNLFADVNNLMGREFQLFQFNNVNTTLSVVPTYNALLAIIADLDTMLATNVSTNVVLLCASLIAL